MIAVKKTHQFVPLCSSQRLQNPTDSKYYIAVGLLFDFSTVTLVEKVVGESHFTTLRYYIEKLCLNMAVNPHIARLLEQSNDVEKNPGPPKVSQILIYTANVKIQIF